MSEQTWKVRKVTATSSEDQPYAYVTIETSEGEYLGVLRMVGKLNFLPTHLTLKEVKEED